MDEIVQADYLDFIRSYHEEPFDFIYMDIPFATGRNFVAYNDKKVNRQEFIDNYTTLFNAILPKLKTTGSLAIHCDYRTQHLIRIAFEDTFGEDNFINQIAWCYNSGGASKRWLARKHDDIIVYGKSKQYKFNVLREPYPQDYSGRPGFHPEGRMMNDAWNISIPSSTAAERVGYPTQKPLALLERLLRVFTDKDDLVGDLCAGSGTTGVAAANLGRRFIMVDVGDEAIKTMKERYGTNS